MLLHALCFYVFQIVYRPALVLFAAAGSRQFDYLQVGGRPDASALDRSGRSRACLRHASSAGGKRARSAQVATCPLLHVGGTAAQRTAALGCRSSSAQSATAWTGADVTSTSSTRHNRGSNQRRVLGRASRFRRGPVSGDKVQGVDQRATRERPFSHRRGTVTAKSVIVSRLIHRATPPWMSKRENISRSPVSRPDRQRAMKATNRSPGGSRRLNGATTSRIHPQHRHLRRDSRQSYRAGHDLSAAFSCGGFSPLDSGRVESAPARTSGVTVSAALRDLRVRI